VNKGIFTILHDYVIVLEFVAGIDFVLWEKFRSGLIDVLWFRGQNLNRPFRLSSLIFFLIFSTKYLFYSFSTEF
jgi:hypothetical protein